MNAFPSRRPRAYAALLAAALALVIAVLPAVSGASPPDEPGARGLAQAIAAQEAHNASLFAIDGVVATGVGAIDGVAVVKVYTVDAAVRSLPAALGDIDVVVQAVGAVTAQPDECGGPPWQRPPSCSGGVDTTARFDRPVPIGVSTGHPDITAGTIGARVTDGTNVYALSNNHVYANENLASFGDAVIQPGSFDGGSSPADDIGTLDQYVEIHFDGSANRVDAAIALTSTSDLSNSTPADGYGTPSSTITTASPGMDVIKYGRTTGQTTGSVDTINATVSVGYDSGSALFTGQVIISGDAGSFSQGGDSGSLIVAADGLQPVALLFAGNNTITVGNPIDEVLSAFGVTIDGAGGPAPTTTTTTSTTTTTTTPPQGNLTVTGMGPDSVEAGGSLDDAVVSGTGFVDGAKVSFTGGNGPAPDVSDIRFVDHTEITIDVSTGTNGPKRDRVWTVVVTNPDGASASGGTLTVTVPQQ